MRPPSKQCRGEWNVEFHDSHFVFPSALAIAARAWARISARVSFGETIIAQISCNAESKSGAEAMRRAVSLFSRFGRPQIVLLF